MTVRLDFNEDFLAQVTAAFGEDVLDARLYEQAFTAALETIQAEVVRSTMARLAKDPTGELARSWEVAVGVSGSEVSGSVRSEVPYARIHNEGGTVRPRRGKYLAIPLRPPLPRGAGRRMMPRHDATPMRAWRSRRGNLLLWDVSRSPPQPRYLLRRETQIPATRYIDIAVEASTDDAHGAFVAVVEEALDRAARGA